MSRHALQVLMSDVPELRDRLCSGYYRRAGVQVMTAPMLSELPRWMPEVHPDVVILDGGVLDPTLEAMVARRIRAQLGGGQLVLALPAGGRRAQHDLQLYDHVVPLAHPDAALAAALAPLVGAPARRAPRAPAAVPALLCPAGAAHVSGTALDLSDTGAGLVARIAPVEGDQLTVVFHRGDGRRVAVAGTVVWAAEAEPGLARLGVRFTAEGRGSVRALRDLAFWEIAPTAAGPTIRVYGLLDGGRDLGRLAQATALVPRLDLEAVTLGEGGIAAFLALLAAVPADVKVWLRCVPPPLRAALGVAGLIGDRVSLAPCFVTYHCPPCRIDVVELVPGPPFLEPPPCPGCGAAMVDADAA
ncbi:MAG TPA: PilZ domain-containing protein [Polyangia bacterium]